jgi:hypothetical protein
MALYPTVAISARTWTQSASVSKTPLRDGSVLRIKQRAEQLMTVTVKHNLLLAATTAALLAFHRACSGSLTEFTYLDALRRVWNDLYVGTGDGATHAFDLPGVAGIAGSWVVYVAGVLQTVSTDYSVSAGTGTDGRDVLTMVGHVPAGDRISATLDGRRAVFCIFAADDLGFDETTYGRDVMAAIRLQEVFHA